MTHPKISWLVCVGLLACALGACAGKLDKPERFASAVKKYTGADASGGSSSPTPPPEDASSEDAGPVEAPDCALELFKNTCALAGCHAKGLPQVDLASAGVAQRLIDEASDSELCKGSTFIATDGTSSLLLEKLTDSPPCGVKMPLGGTISEEGKQCLTDWVNSLSGAEDEIDAGAAP